MRQVFHRYLSATSQTPLEYLQFDEVERLGCINYRAVVPRFNLSVGWRGIQAPGGC